MELTSVAEELYALAPAEFTAARNERAKLARAEDLALSERVAKLPKPSTAAWVMNMLARHQADQLAQVLELGAAMRAAQDNLDGDELRDLGRQRRQLTHAVSTQARGLAHELGVRISEAVTSQVEETLRAAMTDEDASRAVRTGQLVNALSATGVGALDVSGAVAVPEAIGTTVRPVERPKPQLSVVPEPEPEADEADESARALEQARTALQEAEAEARAAETKLAKASRRAAKLEARSLQVSGRLEEVRRRAAALEHELEGIDDDLGDAEDKRDRAQEKQAAAISVVEAARAELDRVSR